MSNEEYKHKIIKLITEMDNTWLLHQLLRLINNVQNNKFTI